MRQDIDIELHIVREINFIYGIFNEDIVVIGMKGEGKTERVKRILESALSDTPYWIWDYSDKFTGYGHLVHRVEDLQYGQYVIQAKDKTITEFRKFCQRVIDGVESGELRNLVIVVDELHQYVTKQSMLQELYFIVMSLRNFGISGIYISTSAQAIPNWILDNMTHVFAYKVNLEGRINWLRTYIGVESWLLTSRDKRKLLFSEKYPDLTKHSFIYRNQHDPRPQIVIT